MAQHIIIICIISILLWYYYIKSKEQDDKYIPVMVRHSELMHENNMLKQENKKLKLRLKYLENYKQDVSKTFKILDSELGLINEHLNKKSQEIQPPNDIAEQNSAFETSLTPTVLNSLIRESHLPSTNSLNNIFNRFLTGDVNFMNNLPHQSSEAQQTVHQDIHQDIHREVEQELEQELTQNNGDVQQEDNQQNNQDNYPRSIPEVHFSVNYLPLNSSYRQFLIRRDPESSNESVPSAPSAPL